MRNGTGSGSIRHVTKTDAETIRQTRAGLASLRGGLRRGAGRVTTGGGTPVGRWDRVCLQVRPGGKALRSDAERRPGRRAGGAEPTGRKRSSARSAFRARRSEHGVSLARWQDGERRQPDPASPFSSGDILAPERAQRRQYETQNGAVIPGGGRTGCGRGRADEDLGHDPVRQARSAARDRGRRQDQPHDGGRQVHVHVVQADGDRGFQEQWTQCSRFLRPLDRNKHGGRGVHVTTMDSGDKIFVKFQGGGTVKDGALQTDSGTWSYRAAPAS